VGAAVTLDELSDRLNGVRDTARGLSARCPAHDDRQNSLSLATGDDGRVLLNCFAQCRPEAIVRAIGLELRDLFQSARAVQPSLRNDTPLDEARRQILHEARRRLRQIDLDRYHDADSIRVCCAVARRARALATALGDTEHAWDLLAQAADLERLAAIGEMRLDEAT
jgi:hypothetical protein